MTHAHLVSEGWVDYELLDSGEGMKLERFGQMILARLETQALWAKGRPDIWKDAHAEFHSEGGKGAWHQRKEVPPPALGWEMSHSPLRFLARLTSFKHVGVFPEQEPNWSWLRARVLDVGRPTSESDVGRRTSHIPSILNLFGYTGIATLAAVHAGAKVTHVDASKQSLDWAHENAQLTGLPEDAVRWILDDALAFAKREARRGAKYDGIILDPPAFGRGPKGEVWHIERDLPTLLTALRELLAERAGAFFLMSGYAAGYSAYAFAQALESAFGTVEGEGGLPAQAGELHIREAASERVVPSGIYCRFVRE
ncbi:MAG: class I SAM-dependent methyltransferase [bacterium]|nr:class I SAM-dependent methyltransferase [bacterium]